MKSLSNLIRTPPFNTYRARRGTIMQMMAKRKQIRRLKKINIYAKQYTNQQIPHNWLNVKKLKVITAYIQSSRNLHHLSNPIPINIKKQMAKQFKQAADWNYYQYRNALQQQLQYQQFIQQSKIDQYLKIVPVKLRKQILEKVDVIIPQIIKPQFLYNQQQNYSLPLSLRHKKNILLQSQIRVDKKGLENEFD